jgi:hypothetical protein
MDGITEDHFRGVEDGWPDLYISEGSCLLPGMSKFAKLNSKLDPSLGTLLD